jgi:hypothetical protein
VKRRVVVLAALSLCFLAGCYERVSHGNESIYRFVWWLGPVIIAAGLLGIPLGWLLRKWSPRWGFVLMVMGPVLLLIIAPAMYSDYVVIDDEHFEAQYGFWFAPSVHNLRFGDLREIRYVAVPGSRGSTYYELRCLSKTGRETVVDAGDLVRNTVPEILTRARARGVLVMDQTR